MKKAVAFVAIVLLLPLSMMAQKPVRVWVHDALSGKPLAGASIQVKGSLLSGQTQANGLWEISHLNPKDYTLIISYLGYKTQTEHITIPNDETVRIALSPSPYLADEVLVQATRAGTNAATTYKNLSKEAIAKNNLGQDLPYMLQQTPSVVVTSDAGAGIGYTGMTIRGSDNQRINVTVNGIPYNDPESMGSFFVNMPDFVSSVDNIQIQRGVGTSTNGAAAFGASVNIQTTGRIDTAYAALDNSYGSYNSWKNTVKIGTGLIDNRFSFDGRLSRIKSDGYIDHAFSDLKSFFLTGAWYGTKSLLRANVFSGKEKTFQAWNGVPEHLLDTHRTYNEFYNDDFQYDNQTDNYTQTHYQLLYSTDLSAQLLLNAALHYTHGEGYYEEYKAEQDFEDYNLMPIEIGGSVIDATDLVRRRWLDNDFYGLTYSLRYTPTNRIGLTLGGAYNHYRGNHFGEVIWAQYASDGVLGDRYYDNDADKKDLNVYGKIDYQLQNWRLFADLQYRTIDYAYEGLNRDRTPLQQAVRHHFFNPKVGVSYLLDNGSNLYASIAVANKEPIRDDYTESSPESRPKPERLTDIELGYRKNAEHYAIGINGYAMLYRDQLVVTGKINDVGAAVRENVESSYRMGLELDAQWNPVSALSWSLAAAISRSKIQDYTYYIDILDENYKVVDQEQNDLKDTDIALSPNAILSNEFAYRPFKNSEIAWISQFVARQFLDNTSDPSKSIDPYFVNHLRLRYQMAFKGIKKVGITLRINNILNELYESNGYTFGYYNHAGSLETYNYYFPQAGTHVMLGLNLQF